MPTPPVVTSDHGQSWYDPGSNSWDRADGPTLVTGTVTAWYKNNTMYRLIVSDDVGIPVPHFWEKSYADSA